jgi:hypothetical protein
MKVANVNINKTTRQKIQLVEGDFTVSEATDIIVSLIDEKLNFHKLQRLSLSEGYSGADTKYPDGRIGELEREKATARAFFAEVRKSGAKITINGTLEISISE